MKELKQKRDETGDTSGSHDEISAGGTEGVTYPIMLPLMTQTLTSMLRCISHTPNLTISGGKLLSYFLMTKKLM